MEIDTGFNGIFAEFDTYMPTYFLVLGIIFSLKWILPLIFKEKKQLIEVLVNFALLLFLNSLVFNIKDILFVDFSFLNLVMILILLLGYIMFFYQLYKYLKRPKAHE